MVPKAMNGGYGVMYKVLSGASGLNIPTSGAVALPSRSPTMTWYSPRAEDGDGIRISRHLVRARLGVIALVIVALLVAPSAAMAVDDYPYPGQSGTDRWGFFKGYCTSFVAWRMNRNAGPMSFYNYMDGGHFGNAGNWAANARFLGIPVNSTPAIGAIAWWGFNTISDLGHVAYVEAVNANGTIVVEEYNYNPRVYTRRTISLSDTRARPSGYIHFHDLPPVPPPPPPDTTPPVIALACVREGGVYAGPVTPSFTAVDAALASVTATLNGSPFAPCTTISAAGSYTLVVTAIDKAGNNASTTACFTVDPDAPGASVAFTTIAGADRYATAVKVSETAFDSAATVVIATGENWPDALGGAALAGAVDGPILLTRAGSLPAATLTEIRRLGAREAIILGGEGAVSADVERTLAAELGEGAVTRLGGLSRYETAEKVVRATRLALGDAYDGGCLVATGEGFPDSLAAAPLSAANGWPLMLTTPDELGPTARAVMDEIGVSSAIVLGGTGVVAESVEATLAAWLGEAAVKRIAGADRYETAAAIADFAVEGGLAWEGAAIATGENFPDALAGGVMQARSGSVLLLTRSAALVDPVRARLMAERASVRSLRYLGGDGAVSCAVKAAADAAVR